jgi:hypothetical protein
MTNLKWRTVLFGATLVSFCLSLRASADSEDDKKLWKCATDICSIIASKNPKGPDLSCDVTKTWDAKQVEKGAESKNLGWGLGSVGCHFKVSVKRADMAAALSSPEGKLKLSKQEFACEVGESRYPIKATAAPELKLNNGSVTAGSLHVEDINGAPLIKGAVWTAAKLERHFGLFEKDLVREANRFMRKECPKFLPTTP